MYAHDVTYYNKANTYIFKMNGKIILYLVKLKGTSGINLKWSSLLLEKMTTLSILNRREFEKVSFSGIIIHFFVLL